MCNRPRAAILGLIRCTWLVSVTLVIELAQKLFRGNIIEGLLVVFPIMLM